MSDIIKVDHLNPETWPPKHVEVLAWHERGKTWHQVMWDGSRWKMRWSAQYAQFLRDHTHWTHLPEAPETPAKTARERAANVVANDREQDSTKSIG